MSHRVLAEWRGEEVETLAELLRPGLRAVCVGINPSPTSVRAGHYYQGPIGKRFLSRLEQVGLIPPGDGWEDDRAYAAGVGFTDIVRKPTRRASELTEADYSHGRQGLIEKLGRHKPGLAIFTFKKTAAVLVGKSARAGLLPERVGGVPLFVMPGPYAPTDEANKTLAELERLVSADGYATGIVPEG